MQEEERLKQENIESVHLATTSYDKNANKKRKRSNSNKGKKVVDNGTSQPKVQRKQDKIIICFFARKMDM